MATQVSVMLCPKCQALLEGTPNACPICKEDITEAERRPLEETVSIPSGKPSPQLVEQIKAASSKGVPPSVAEVRHAFATLLLMGAVGVAMFFFGMWVIRGFRGPGVIVFGYGAVLAGPIAALYGIFVFIDTLLSERRGKTPARSFEKIWNSGYFSEFSLWNAKKATGNRVLRSLPRITGLPSREEILQYCEELKAFVNADLDALEGQLTATGKWTGGNTFDISKWGIMEISPMLQTEPLQVTELGNGVSEVRGVVSFVRTRQYSVSDQKKYEMKRAVLRLDITSYCVKNGRFYYIVNAMPALPPLLEKAPAAIAVAALPAQ